MKVKFSEELKIDFIKFLFLFFVIVLIFLGMGILGDYILSWLYPDGEYNDFFDYVTGFITVTLSITIFNIAFVLFKGIFNYIKENITIEK
jgi:hypothetical protein